MLITATFLLSLYDRLYETSGDERDSVTMQLDFYLSRVDAVNRAIYYAGVKERLSV